MKRAGKRVLRSVLSVALLWVMMAGLVLPSLTTESHAASWADTYIDKLVEWGVMRGDINGNMNPDRAITRAEFVTMVNRAYGYKELGENPFRDVREDHWFYQDVCIARKIGYFKGVTEETALPYSSLTRAQAAVILGRNMMLQEGTGEALGFTDSRELGAWSRKMVEAVTNAGIIGGYADGSFRPQNPVTRGHVAAMLTRAIGTPVQQPGTHELGGVYGNLTITSPGVTLRNTTVVGDLYISGGVALGDVKLENVQVTGKIIVSGAGESEQGEQSVTLRNVTSEELVLDSIADQFVTLRADGLTKIKTTNVRTGVYLEDVTQDGLGLQTIRLDGAPAMAFQLAGNIKELVNLTPGSVVTIAQGVAQKVTVDEVARESTLDLNKNTIVSQLNLDTGVSVNGTGDIDHVNINAAGTTVAMLPDSIVMRPGIQATVFEEEMDSLAAVESSSEPRILSGYPQTKNVAPRTADVVFKTNKKGTLYWALTALNDGSVSASDLLNPPVYSGKIIQKGTLEIEASETEITQKLSGLTAGGAYYVSAMLVDNRDMRSAVKVTAFTTPDDTVPAFTSGYPQTVLTIDDSEEQIVQVLAMANKDCQMYYALMPKGSVALKGADFISGAVKGNLGYGMVELDKNTLFTLAQVNSKHLEEVTEYDLYLWLTDADRSKSSAVKKLTVTTLDQTKPKLLNLSVKDIAERSVTISYTINEPGTLYWAVVKEGMQFFTSETIAGEVPTKTDMIQIESGINSITKGSSKASKANTEVTFTINRLEPQTAYDIYYVVKDTAGNYCDYDIKVISIPYTVYTLDNEKPTVKQEFTHDGSDTAELTPYPDTSIRLVFSENVQGMKDLDQDGRYDYTVFLDAYNTLSPESFGDLLSKYIKLYKEGDSKPLPVRNASNENGDWVIDYRKARIEQNQSGTGELVLTIPYHENKALSGLNLLSGVTYYFTLEDIADASVSANRMEGKYGIATLPEFTTISARIMLKEKYLGDAPADVHMTFTATPISNQSLDRSVLWDLVVWSESTITFKVYERLYGESQWKQVGSKELAIRTADGKLLGTSVGYHLRDQNYEILEDLREREFGIEITSINGETNKTNWNVPVTVRLTAVSGDRGALMEAGNQLRNSRDYASVVQNNNKISDITSPTLVTLTRTFVDNTSPQFNNKRPSFEPDDSSVRISISMDRLNSYYYYVVAPVGGVYTMIDGTELTAENIRSMLPNSGEKPSVYSTLPTSDFIMTYKPTTTIKGGSGRFNGSVEPFAVTGLQPKTDYVVYFVLQGESQDSFSPKPYCFYFTTGEVETPIITLIDNSPQVGVSTSTNAEVDWILMASSMLSRQEVLTTKFYEFIDVNHNDKNDLSVTKTTKQTDFEKNFKKYFPNYDGNPEDVRVIDALMASVGDNDTMSVFDKYAGADIYNQVLRVVQGSTGTSYVTDKGSTSTSRDTLKIVSPTGMVTPTQYYFIAAALNVLGGNYGFKAVNNIHVVDAAPPQVGSCITELTAAYQPNVGDTLGDAVSLSTALNSPGSHAFSGTVSITFSKTPYYVYTDSNNVTHEEALTNDNLKNLIMGAGVKDATIQNQTIKITFERVAKGATLTLFNGGVVGDIYGNTQNKVLVLRFDPPYVNPDNKNPVEFTWSWSKA